jgi:hypothetical protein
MYFMAQMERRIADFTAGAALENLPDSAARDKPFALRYCPPRFA